MCGDHATASAMSKSDISNVLTFKKFLKYISKLLWTAIFNVNIIHISSSTFGVIQMAQLHLLKYLFRLPAILFVFKLKIVLPYD